MLPRDKIRKGNIYFQKPRQLTINILCWTTEVQVSNRIGDPNSLYPESMSIIRWDNIPSVSANAQILHLGSKAAKVKLKKIGGSLYERWSVWFNSIIHVKSYQCIEYLFCQIWSFNHEQVLIGTAWLSSVRVVKCHI